MGEIRSPDSGVLNLADLGHPVGPFIAGSFCEIAKPDNTPTAVFCPAHSVTRLARLCGKANAVGWLDLLTAAIR
jgi:hypothetical protein